MLHIKRVYLNFFRGFSNNANNNIRTGILINKFLLVGGEDNLFDFEPDKM